MGNVTKRCVTFNTAQSDILKVKVIVLYSTVHLCVSLADGLSVFQLYLTIIILEKYRQFTDLSLLLTVSEEDMKKRAMFHVQDVYPLLMA